MAPHQGRAYRSAYPLPREVVDASRSPGRRSAHIRPRHWSIALVLTQLSLLACGVPGTAVDDGPIVERTSALRLTGALQDSLGQAWQAGSLHVIGRLRTPASCAAPVRDDGWQDLPVSSAGAFGDTLYAYDGAADARQCLQLRVEAPDGAVVLDSLIPQTPTGPLGAPPTATVTLRVRRGQTIR